MTTVRQHRIFGRQTVPHTVILARGDKVRHFTVRPWTIALSTTVASAVVAACVGAGAYLLMRDDIAASGTVHQERLQHDYEARIASLRAQLDRAVSRQLLDRETVETKVDVLLDQQLALTERYEMLRPLLDRARLSGLVGDAVPIPQPKPAEDQAEAPGAEDAAALAFGAEPALPGFDRFALIDPETAETATSDTTKWRLSASSGTDGAPNRALWPSLVEDIGRSIDKVEERQIAGLFGLTLSARTKAAGIASALRSEGIRIPLPGAEGETQVGMEGPADGAAGGSGGLFVPVPQESVFELRFADLDNALAELQSLRQAALQLPLGTPVPGAPVSSAFGVRPDPFLGRSAMHTGIDFVATSGTTATVAASGTVVEAGANGGYGNMVVVDHGRGVTTRYAHMSAILVSVGDRLEAGDPVGLVGSTGRSTGPHLHYEVRRDGEPVDPSRFLRAGRKIEALG